MPKKITVPVTVRWSDIDAYSHVNNAELLRILEEARIHAFWASPDPDRPPTAVLDATPGSQTATLIARLEIEYLRPIPYQRRSEERRVGKECRVEGGTDACRD